MPLLVVRVHASSSAAQDNLCPDSTHLLSRLLPLSGLKVLLFGQRWCQNLLLYIFPSHSLLELEYRVFCVFNVFNIRSIFSQIQAIKMRNTSVFEKSYKLHA